MRPEPSLGLRERFGLKPLLPALRQARLVFAGDAFTRPSRFDTTSLAILRPRWSLPLWAGRRIAGRLAPIYNFFNHTPSDPEDGWSVRKTHVRDFRGGTDTYDSHNGTDFAVPVGTLVVAAAPGVVLRVSNEFHRGGLKVMIDHGAGVVTTSNHLARAVVGPGDRVARGAPVGWSGASGIDVITMFPWSTPHVHYNTWQDGVPVDPFSLSETPLWRDGNRPLPDTGPPDAAFEASVYDEARVEQALAACLHPESRAEIEREPTLELRAGAVMFHQNYYPLRFRAHVRVYTEPHARTGLLTLPLAARDFDGVAYPDEV